MIEQNMKINCNIFVDISKCSIQYSSDMSGNYDIGLCDIGFRNMDSI